MSLVGAIGAGIGAVGSIMGGIVGAQGATYQGEAQAAQANYQAGVAQANAKIAAGDADYALTAGQVQVQQVGMAARQQIGATKAAFGAGNIDVSSGSASRVVESEAELAQTSEGVAAANARKTAYGYSVTAAEDTAQAGLYESEAATAPIAASYAAESSLISGFTGAATKFTQMAGSFGPPGAATAPAIPAIIPSA